MAVNLEEALGEPGRGRLEEEPESLSLRGDLPAWRPPFGEGLRDAWQSRHLLWPLAVRIVPVYQGRILGRAWLVIRPFMHVFGFAVVFGGVLGAKAPNGVPYLVFMLLGLQAFRLFEQSLYYETLSSRMVKNQTRSLRVPLLLIPFAAMLRALIEVLIYWVFTVAVLIYYVVTKSHLYLVIGPRLLVGLAGLVLCLAFGLALGLFTSVIYPRVMDIRYAVRYVVQLWIFLTPVFYSLQTVPHSFRTAMEYNPLTPLVGLVQYGFLDAGSIHVFPLVAAVATVAVIGAFGLWFFNALSYRYIGVYSRGPDGDPEDDDVEGGF